MANLPITWATPLTQLRYTDMIPVGRAGVPTAYNIDVAILTEVFNVKHYGAVGNGIVDDTVAIKAAITALLAVGGGALYFPSGTYRVTSTLTIKLTGATVRGAQVYGNGPSSIINYTPADGTDCLRCLGPSVLISNLHIHDLSFVGAGFASATGNAIRLQRCIMPNQISNINIEHFGGGAGIYVESSWLSILSSIWTQENKYGVLLTNDPVAGGWGSTIGTTLHNCHLQSSSSHGLYVPVIAPGAYTVGNITVDTCIIEGNVGSGIYAYGIINFAFHNIYFELNHVGTGDIFLERCIFGKIELCSGHTPPAFQSLTLDAACVAIYIGVNNWQGTVTYAGTLIYDILSSWTTAANTAIEHQTLNSIIYFAADDATPSVKNGIYESKFCYTANVNATTITNLDDGFTGQDIYIIVGDALTTFDFTASWLKGNNGGDYIAGNGDVIHAIRDNFGFWYCQIIK